jgi:hypothetical protein
MNDQLGKLIEPEPVPLTFGAPGWYVVGGLLLVLVLLLVWLIVRHYRINLYRQHALVLLADTEQKYNEVQNFDLLVYEADMLIKRIAMSRYGRENVSALRNGQWIEFINSKWHERSFGAQDEKLFNQVYQSQQSVSADDASLFVEKTKRWIKKHSRK